MTTEEKILWTKISSFRLDDENSSFKFSERLSRENGWTISFSKKAIEEYKKFIFLSCITNEGVTPSDQVDQVWHLHLTFTKSYWIDFCKNTLSKEIHHNPTKGGNIEEKKFDDFYTSTLILYKEKFKIDPTNSIWPENKKRFSDINFQRVNLKNYWLLKKPKLIKKNISILTVVTLACFFIYSKSENSSWIVLIPVIIFSFVVWEIFTEKLQKNKRNKNRKDSTGCSSGSGCSGCSGDSGGDGGSGCSGCGGGGGGGD